MASKYSSKQILDDGNLKEFGKDYVKILTIFLKKEGKVASGALIASLESKVINERSGARLQILANDYLEWVDQGRRPGKFPPIRAISQWARVKGIAQSAVWPIAMGIKINGIDATNVLSKTTNEILTSPALNRKYEDTLVENIENIILDEFKQLNND